MGTREAEKQESLIVIMSYLPRKILYFIELAISLLYIYYYLEVF